MKEVEAKVKEASNKNSELDIEEVELKKKCADLTRALLEHMRFLEHKQGKLNSIESKVSLISTAVISTEKLLFYICNLGNFVI